MTNAQPPQAKPGVMCPLHKKDVSKVCHKCAWWSCTRVQPPGGEPYDHWDCAIRLNLIISRNAVIAAEGMQAATEEFRNRVWDVGKAIVGLAGARAALPNAPASKLIGDAK